MSWNKFRFKSIGEFLSVKDVAVKNGIETVDGFNKFLEENYKHLKA